MRRRVSDVKSGSKRACHRARRAEGRSNRAVASAAAIVRPAFSTADSVVSLSVSRTIRTSWRSRTRSSGDCPSCALSSTRRIPMRIVYRRRGVLSMTRPPGAFFRRARRKARLLPSSILSEGFRPEELSRAYCLTPLFEACLMKFRGRTSFVAEECLCRRSGLFSASA